MSVVANDEPIRRCFAIFLKSIASPGKDGRQRNDILSLIGECERILVRHRVVANAKITVSRTRSRPCPAGTPPVPPDEQRARECDEAHRKVENKVLHRNPLSPFLNREHCALFCHTGMEKKVRVRVQVQVCRWEYASKT
ncbi:hypothetical protein [Rubripirellula lacrimiformis]|uniref:hypothetical protein n=1 Tax=Rubripirellula lacrimiformis TaxID=1930273 RepID=UPI0011A925BE|nr:hypothetical protein [Rubripirellula lacrimiformis]